MSENPVIELPREGYSRKDSREVATLPTEAATPMSMLAVAVQKGMDPQTIRDLLALQKEWEANEARKAFNNAVAAAKAEIPVIKKNREVDFTSNKGRTHYKYEDLAEVARTIDPILARHGLSYRFRTTSALNEPVSVTCILAHRSGYSEENMLCAGRDDSGNKNSIQAIGSTLTYLQRMTLKASLGLSAAEDDDGSGGKGREEIAADDPDRKALEDCGSIAALQKVWKGFSAEQRKRLVQVMNECHEHIKQADAQ